MFKLSSYERQNSNERDGICHMDRHMGIDNRNPFILNPLSHEDELNH
jgi:hypothetical protein